MKYNIWENNQTKELALRPESTVLSERYWAVVHSIEVESREEANAAFREMGGEP